MTLITKYLITQAALFAALAALLAAWVWAQVTA